MIVYQQRVDTESTKESRALQEMQEKVAHAEKLAEKKHAIIEQLRQKIEKILVNDKGSKKGKAALKPGVVEKYSIVSLLL